MNASVIDKGVATLFLLAIFLLIYFFMSNNDFFNWAFDRHHNTLSWYVRPIFLIPFCFFAFKRSLAGITGTIFLLLTSMFWFSKPHIVDEQVANFLLFEKNWLQSTWDMKKTAFTLIVPLSLYLLALVFWKKLFLWGWILLTFIAVGKILWSIYYSGENGVAVVLPGIIGLVFCVVILYWALNRNKTL